MREITLLALLGAASLAAADSGTVSVTPHDSYSSSVGVLGCMIDTDRVAYWPDDVDCTSLCVSLSYGGRSVYLLRIDQSGGAHDVSYDAWNYLYTGYSATDRPTAGGGVDMQYEDVDMSNCASLIRTPDGNLPLSAANSMDFLASCLDAGNATWSGNNYVLYNILDPICSWGYDEVCTLDWPAENQATCPHTLGLDVPLTTEPVYNIMYPSGDTVLASSGVVVANASNPTTDAPGGSSGGARYRPDEVLGAAILVASVLVTSLI